MSAPAPEQLRAAAGPESHGDEEFLTDAEHALLKVEAWAELNAFVVSDCFQHAVVPRNPDAPFSLHVVYPDQTDAASEQKRRAAHLVNKYNFICKDGDPLDGYDAYNKIELLVTDNRRQKIEPAGALEVLCYTPGLPPHSILAMGGKPWYKDIAATIQATRMFDGSPLPNLLDEAEQAKIYDISLLGVLPAHRRDGELYDSECDVMGILYNGLGRLAEAEGVERMVAAIDVKVLRGLQRFRGHLPLLRSHWHQFEGIEPLLYESKVRDSNKTTVATVHMPTWQADMADHMPGHHRMIWGHEYENKGTKPIEFVGLRPKNLYDTVPRHPNFTTDKLNRFTQTHQTPYLLMDLGLVGTRYRSLEQTLPDVRIHYAMKANPERPILERLASLDSAFEIASVGELRRLQAIGVDPADILSSNPVKFPQHIREEYEAGVDRFAFSSSNELRKIAAAAPGSRVFVRLETNADESTVPSEGKFGVDIYKAKELMMEAGRLGLKAYGVGFHVGSQMEHPNAWRRAIARSGQLLELLGEEGIRVDMLDIGGGFPATHRAELPGLHAYAKAINEGIAALPYRPSELIAEPGRALVADAGVIAAEVLDVIPGDPARVYLGLGAFVLIETLQNPDLQYPITDSRQAQDGASNRLSARIMAGSCDSMDTIASRSRALSADLRPGDTVYIGTTGGYSTVYGSGFNDLPPTNIHYIGWLNIHNIG